MVFRILCSFGEKAKNPGAEQQHEHSRKGKHRALSGVICQSRNPAWSVGKALPEDVMLKLGTHRWKEIHSKELGEEKVCQTEGMAFTSSKPRHGMFGEIVEYVHLFTCFSHLAEFLKDVKSSLPGLRRSQWMLHWNPNPGISGSLSPHLLSSL